MRSENDELVGYEKYGYEVLRIRNELTVKITSETDFTDASAIRAIEWVVFEQKLHLRDAAHPEATP